MINMILNHRILENKKPLDYLLLYFFFFFLSVIVSFVPLVKLFTIPKPFLIPLPIIFPVSSAVFSAFPFFLSAIFSTSLISTISKRLSLYNLICFTNNLRDFSKKSSGYLQSIILSWKAFGRIHLLSVASPQFQFLPFSLIYRESTLRRYNISIKSREPPKMEKPYRSSITRSRFGLSCTNIYKANNPLFPRRLLELLLSIKDLSILYASTFVILFSYFNLFGGFQ